MRNKVVGQFHVIMFVSDIREPHAGIIKIVISLPSSDATIARAKVIMGFQISTQWKPLGIILKTLAA